MDKAETLISIEQLLAEWKDDPERWSNAEEIYDRMPACLAELSHEASFRDLVRWAMHDLFREATERG